MKPNDFVLVIGRQFGAGGRKLGKELSNRLNIPYYDKELLSEAAKRLGIMQKVFDKADEKKPSLLHALLNFNYFSPTGHFSTSSMNAEDLYALQSKVIRQIAQEGPCIIVGRTADYILRDRDNMVSIFLHADPEIRARHIIERGDAQSVEDAVELAQRNDKLRKEYYNYFSGREWGVCSTYHFSIDSSNLTTNDIADQIMLLLDALSKKL